MSDADRNEGSGAGTPGAERADESGANAPDAGLTPIEQRIVEALKTVYDPEIPIDIYELGLIYEIKVDEEGKHADIKMTLTAPGCPVAATFPDTVRLAVESVEGIHTATVELVWYPPWTPDMMSEAARLQLGFF